MHLRMHIDGCGPRCALSSSIGIRHRVMQRSASDRSEHEGADREYRFASLPQAAADASLSANQLQRRVPQACVRHCERAARRLSARYDYDAPHSLLTHAKNRSIRSVCRHMHQRAEHAVEPHSAMLSMSGTFCCFTIRFEGRRRRCRCVVGRFDRGCMRMQRLFSDFLICVHLLCSEHATRVRRC
jgi:hypothetical protein